MAATGGNTLTLIDHAKLKDPTGKIARVANVLSQVNDWNEMMHWQESNKDTCEQITIQTGLPTTSTVKIGEGVVASKPTTAQIQEGFTILETRNEIYRHLAIGENLAEFRATQDRPAMESLKQKAGGLVIYGNASADSTTINGLAARYSATGAANGANIVLGGGTTGNQTSIYLICSHQDGVYMTYPKGTMAGIEHTDLGLITDQNAGGTGRRAEMWSSVFNWRFGLVVKDWRDCVRIPNIQVGEVAGLTGAQAPTAFTNVLHAVMRGIPRFRALRPDPGHGPAQSSDSARPQSAAVPCPHPHAARVRRRRRSSRRSRSVLRRRRGFRCSTRPGRDSGTGIAGRITHQVARPLSIGSCSPCLFWGYTAPFAKRRWFAGEGNEFSGSCDAGHGVAAVFFRSQGRSRRRAR